jgi:hypothetical protein
MTNRPREQQGTSIGYWAFWLQLAGMFGMTLSFATAGIGQVYLERIMGMGYLDAQLKIQVHFLMLIATASGVHGRRSAVHLRLLPLPAAVRGGCRSCRRRPGAPGALLRAPA